MGSYGCVRADTRDTLNMPGLNGIKYDAKGQNTLALALLLQLEGKTYAAVWPDHSALRPLVLPFKGWT